MFARAALRVWRLSPGAAGSARNVFTLAPCKTVVSKPCSFALAATVGCAVLHYQKSLLVTRGALLCDEAVEDDKESLRAGLLETIRRGDVSAALKALNDADWHIDEPLTSFGQNALFVACCVGVLPLVAALLEAGCDPNAWDSKKWNSLSAACASGNAHIVKKLLEWPEVCTSALDANGLAPIHQAVVFGHPDCLHYILEHRVDPNLRTGDALYWSPGGEAAAQSETALHIVSRLLTSAINTQERSASTLHHQQQWRAIMELLVHHGGDPLARDLKEDTPLHHCARHGDTVSLWLLLGHVPDIAVALHATNSAGVSVADELAGTHWTAGLVVHAAMQMQSTRLWWRQYCSVYEFIGRQ